MTHENIWILEIPETSYRKTWGMKSVHSHDFRHQGYYFTSKLSQKEAKKLKKILTRRNIFCRIYPEEYARSSDYRRIFMQVHPPDRHGYYRCAYCGRKIKAGDMEVDHIIPVAKARKYKKYQKKLKNGVNDISNMVPACRKCNRKKSDSTGFVWTLRRHLMRHAWGRKVWIFTKVLFWCVFAASCFYLYRHPEAVAKAFGVLGQLLKGV